jgi:1-acyl-sn-glycerol-3-phosphate acyltransferase
MKKSFVWFSKKILAPIIKIFIKEIEGEENLYKYPNFIIASNHINSLDHFFIGFLLKERLEKVRFVAASLKSIKTFLISGLLYYFSNPIIIDKERVEREEFLKEATDHLKNGGIVVIYPEGDTNKNGFLLEGKTGVAELSLKSGLPVIPIGISGNCFIGKTIRIGKPIIFKEEQRNFLINSEGYDKSLLRELTDRIMEEISLLSFKPYIPQYVED